MLSSRPFGVWWSSPRAQYCPWESRYGLPPREGRRVGLCQGHAEHYAERRATPDGAGPPGADLPTSYPSRLTQGLPGSPDRAPTYRGLDVAVGEGREHYGYRQLHDQQRQPDDAHVKLGATDHKNGPMPQIDAVRSHPDSTQRPPPQQTRSQMCVRVDDYQDDDGGHERDRGEAATVEEGLRLVKSEAE